jgi:imidazolonepropionase-like amidohydrolase
MRKAVRELIDIGVDQIKLSMTGEEITGTQRAEDTYFSDEECAAAVTEADRRGKRVCAHARSAESVKMCVRNHVDVIYHASFTDAEGMDMLEASKDWVFVAPGLKEPGDQDAPPPDQDELITTSARAAVEQRP